jgi:hypothetical protein
MRAARCRRCRTLALVVAVHSYSVGADERGRVYFTCAAAAVMLAWVFNWLLRQYEIDLPWWFESPSVLGFYGSLVALFDRVLWRTAFGRLTGLSHAPNLDGRWVGKITSSFENFERELPATLDIDQTWTRIGIRLSTKNSGSQSEGASLVRESETSTTFSYLYLSEPRPGAVGTMQTHRGTARLALVSESSQLRLRGEYYTGRGRLNVGEMDFRRE